jgi:hypothetical protein
MGNTGDVQFKCRKKRFLLTHSSRNKGLTCNSNVKKKCFLLTHSSRNKGLNYEVEFIIYDLLYYCNRYISITLIWEIFGWSLNIGMLTINVKTHLKPINTDSANHQNISINSGDIVSETSISHPLWKIVLIIYTAKPTFLSFTFLISLYPSMVVHNTFCDPWDN